MAVILSFFWGSSFYFASFKNDFKNKKISLLKLIIFFSLAEFLRSFLFTGFPWVLLGLAFIDTPISQTLSIFGPYWLTFIIIFLCFMKQIVDFILDLIKYEIIYELPLPSN